ncbi:DUF488 domain-containing protein [Allomuricauda sp. F6463D]|uniref:DUF488 domain-containing protein n=1 Tax=Allomuricauda sp. F6463D TaxID=2926409 RepID=UPI001FF50215|nr:DUF488 domain-containing protein [Muricauda sp. F6463D]MCK0159084.1 DUF488 domain-containing protein [Muricauda sp. F6463D]
MSKIKVKRIYETPSDRDGYRILIDRLWPRGVSKSKAEIDSWNKEIAPSEHLRKWFGHDPKKFVAFEKRYREELENKQEELNTICKRAKTQHITLLYAAKDIKHNHALVLKYILESRLYF